MNEKPFTLLYPSKTSISGAPHQATASLHEGRRVEGDYHVTLAPYL